MENSDLAGYFRFSSKETRRDGPAFAHHYSKLVGFGVPEDNIFWDVESGAKSDREDYQKLLMLVKQGRYKRVAIAVQERLTRSIVDWENILKEFRQAKAKLIFLDESSPDLDTLDGRTFTRIRAIQAQWEWEKNSERHKKKWEHKRANSEASRAVFGYLVDRKTKRLVFDHQPFVCLLDTRQQLSRYQLAREVVALYSNTRSLWDTTEKFHTKYGIIRENNYRHRTRKKIKEVTLGYDPDPERPALGFCRAGLKMWLIHPALRGHTVYFRDTPQQQIHHNTHPPLITEEEYREIEQIMRQNQRHGGFGKTRGRYPLSGLVVCGSCGGGCVSERPGKTQRERRNPRTYYYYRCNNAAAHGCSNRKYIRSETVESAVIAALILRAEQLAQIASTPLSQPDPPELHQLKSQLAALLAIPSPNPAIQEAIADLKRQIQGFEVSKHVQEANNSQNWELLETAFSDPMFYQTLSEQDKRRLLHALVDRVIVKDTEVLEVKLKV